MTSSRVAVLMTSFNRREMTLRSLAALSRQTATGMEKTIFLVDDASMDGTGEAVQSRFPSVRILRGDGSLFWNGGMRIAFAAALAESFDAYVFLNDDTILYEDALERLEACADERLAAGEPAIVVGSTLSPQTRAHTYGGIVRRVHGVRVKLEKVPPGAQEAIPCDTMNGNCVFIPRAIADSVGNLDAGFRHQFGDIDYGLRAKRMGFDLVVLAGFIGECAANSILGTWRDRGMSLAQRWKHLLSPKGVPVREWLLFTRRHFGWRWVYYAVSPYFNTIASSLLPRWKRLT